MEITIAATDDDEAIREKITAALEPLTPEGRRRVMWWVRLRFDAVECDHEGMGLPGCPTCGPRTRAKLAEMGVEW